MNLMQKETHEYVSRSTTEARKMTEEVEIEAQKMSMVEKEAAEYLQVCQFSFICNPTPITNQLTFAISLERNVFLVSSWSIITRV